MSGLNGSDKMSNSNDEQRPDGDGESSERGAQPTMCLTSDEVNYLIYRYLQESGFVHSAFTFVYESMLGRSNIRNADKSIPPGALITFLQKGLQYAGIEESLYREDVKSRKSSASADAPTMTLLSPQTISALTRENPPIQLNVPPATAAAAVRARLEAEAKIEEDRKAAAVQEAMDNAQANGAPRIHGPNGLPPQVAMEDPHLLARNAIANQAAHAVVASAAAMGQLHNPMSVSESEAAALLAQQRREVAAQMVVLQEEHRQQQQQLQQQLQLQKLQQDQQLQQLQVEGGQSAASEAAATLASVAGKLSGTKRTASGTKKGPKSKGKGSLHAKQLSAELEASEMMATLGKAADLAEKVTSKAQEATPMDVEENDESTDGPAQPAHSDSPSHEVVNGGHNSSALNGGKDVEGKTKDSSHPHRKEGAPSKGADAVIDKEDETTNASPDEVLVLKMHSSEVFMCAWNPVFTDLIATGSGDASARIWQMGGKKAAQGLGAVRLLPHGTGPRDKKNKDVTTLEWSSDGNLLATGSYDGVARVWNRFGTLVHTLRGHKGPIFSLKWNKRGNFLLSGSYDKTTIVWDVSSSNGFIEQQFHDHQAPALDVDWKDDTIFASCSTDKTVHICRVGTAKPLKTYTGHTDEVNAVKWDPSGALLASCSDDCTAKVWDVQSDREDPLHDFKSHQREIYTVKWSPTGPGSPNPGKQSVLATASFDGSVRLWNVMDGTCIQMFSRHRESVYSVAFSPSGAYLASGSLAGQLYIWNVQDGKRLKSFKGNGDIFEVAWNKEGSQVAACFSSNVVCIIDF
eukprot:Nitzschia sp. Nitz4//scaffold3_size479765//124131//126796//NITZ4_000054-RA/size479765-processed-gene-0.98-mRNA-1//-1//CDS//3329550620//6904//frame0